MQPALIERVCHVCGARASVEAPRERELLLRPACLRCFTPYLLTHSDDQVELILLTMYSTPSAVDHCRIPVQILCEIAPTREAVERVRGELHAIDARALAERTRVTEPAWLEDEIFVYFLRDQVEASVSRMLRDTESGLLRWRIDNLCDTACAANEARARHHRTLSE